MKNRNFIAAAALAVTLATIIVVPPVGATAVDNSVVVSNSPANITVGVPKLKAEPEVSVLLQGNWKVRQAYKPTELNSKTEVGSKAEEGFRFADRSTLAAVVPQDVYPYAPVPMIAHSSGANGILVGKDGVNNSTEEPEIFGRALVDENFVLAADELWQDGAKEFYVRWLKELSEADGVDGAITARAAGLRDDITSSSINATEFTERAEVLLRALDAGRGLNSGRPFYLSASADENYYGAFYYDNSDAVRAGEKVTYLAVSQLGKDGQVAIFNKRDVVRHINRLGVN